MLTVEKTDDKSYIRSTVMEPSMRRRISLGFNNSDEHEKLLEEHLSNGENLFYRVTDGGDDKGLVGFVTIDPEPCAGVYVIHVCLRTLGRRTVEVVAKSISRAKKDGAKIIYAVFFPERKDLVNLANKLGFRPEGKISGGLVLYGLK